MFSSWIGSLSYVMLLVLVFVLKSVLSDKSIAVPVLFLCLFGLNILNDNLEGLIKFVNVEESITFMV